MSVPYVCSAKSDVRGLKGLTVLNKHTTAFEQIIFSRNNQKNNQMQLCENERQTELSIRIRSFFPHFPYFFIEMELVKDGSLLSDIIFDLDTKLYRAVIFDVKTGKLLFISGTEHQVHSSAISSETGRLVLGLFDGTIELYDIETGDCLHRISLAHLGSVHRIYTIDDGTIAMTTAGGLDSKDRSIRFWRLHKDRIALLAVFTPDAKVSSMNISGDGHLVALEITEVVPFVLTTETNINRKELQLRTFNEFSCSFVVDLTDFKVYDS